MVRCMSFLRMVGYGGIDCGNGSSFVTDATGEIVMQAERDKEMIVYGESDLDENRELRVGWGLFRDRRPEMYAKNF